MKIQVLNQEGKKIKDIETEIFDGKIRKDIIQKVVETEKIRQPYAPFYLAGKQASASGILRHARRKWKTAYGKGISRVPRKIFRRSGTQFYWQGATVASTRGGRRAHPPKILGMINTKKINKKEKQFAFSGALALTASLKEVQSKYKTLQDKKIEVKLPIVFDNKILSLKSKQFLDALKRILNDFYDVALQKKSIRAGKGKARGRRYKKSAGALFIVGKDEKKKIQGIEIKKAQEVNISDLASNGARLVIYTEDAVKELEKRLGGKEK